MTYQADITVSNELLASMLAGIEGVTPGPYNEAVDYDFQTDPIASFQSNDADANGGKRIANFFGPDRFANARHAQRCDPDTMRTILTELSARRAAADVTEAWQGMETAPQDRTILVSVAPDEDAGRKPHVLLVRYSHGQFTDWTVSYPPSQLAGWREVPAALNTPIGT